MRYHLPSIAQKTRTLIDVATLVGVLAYMAWLGAPSWSLVLVIYVASRTSRLDTASDSRAVQSSIQSLEESNEKTRLLLSNAIGEARNEREKAKRDKLPPHVPRPGSMSRVPPGERDPI